MVLAAQARVSVYTLRASIAFISFPPFCVAAMAVPGRIPGGPVGTVAPILLGLPFCLTPPHGQGPLPHRDYGLLRRPQSGRRGDPALDDRAAAPRPAGRDHGVLARSRGHETPPRRGARENTVIST